MASVRAVIVSVNYADFLKNTLSAWRKFLPADTLKVVTARDDADTIAVAKRWRVPVHATDAWTRTDALPNLVEINIARDDSEEPALG